MIPQRSPSAPSEPCVITEDGSLSLAPMTVREYLNRFADLIEREYDPEGGYWQSFQGLSIRAEKFSRPGNLLRAKPFLEEQGISGWSARKRSKEETLGKLRRAALWATPEREEIAREYCEWRQTVERARRESYLQEWARTRPIGR